MTNVVNRFLLLEYLIKHLETGIVNKVAERMNFANLWIKNVFVQYEEISKNFNVPFTFKSEYTELDKVKEIIATGRELCKDLYINGKKENSLELTRIYIYIQEVVFLLQEYKIEIERDK